MRTPHTRSPLHTHRSTHIALASISPHLAHSDSPLSVGTTGLNTDEYVSIAEFPALLHYFRQYLELWLMFEAVDTGGLNFTSGNSISAIGASLGDKKISIEEFR